MTKKVLVFSCLLCISFLNNSFAMDNDSNDEDELFCGRFGDEIIAPEPDDTWANYLNAIKDHLRYVEQGCDAALIKMAIFDYELGLKTKDELEALLEKFFQKSFPKIKEEKEVKGTAEKKKSSKKQGEDKDLGEIQPLCSIQ